MLAAAIRVPQVSLGVDRNRRYRQVPAFAMPRVEPMMVIGVSSILVGASLVLGAAVNLEERRRFRPRPANLRQLSNRPRQDRLPLISASPQ